MKTLQTLKIDGKRGIDYIKVIIFYFLSIFYQRKYSNLPRHLSAYKIYFVNRRVIPKLLTVPGYTFFKNNSFFLTYFSRYL